MRKPKRFKKLVAWYYRNFKYKNLTELIEFDSYMPQLFEKLYGENGNEAIYLGNNQFVITKRQWWPTIKNG